MGEFLLSWAMAKTSSFLFYCHLSSYSCESFHTLAHFDCLTSDLIMPTAIQPGNSTTDASHIVQVTSSVGILVGLVAIIIFAVWISHRRFPSPTSSTFSTNYWIDQDRLRKDLADHRRCTLSSVPVVKYCTELQKEVFPDFVPNAHLPGEASQASNSNERISLKQGAETESLCCPVCTDDFVDGEKVRILPCRHIYHQCCIDPWLLEKSGTCPIW
jgi:hypothetical protein